MNEGTPNIPRVTASAVTFFSSSFISWFSVDSKKSLLLRPLFLRVEIILFGSDKFTLLAHIAVKIASL